MGFRVGVENQLDKAWRIISLLHGGYLKGVCTVGASKMSIMIVRVYLGEAMLKHLKTKKESGITSFIFI